MIADCGELHVEICLTDLKDEYAQCDFIVSDPVVSYRETVSETSSVTCLAKSPNKHNRIYLQAEPMDEELNKAIDDGPTADPKYGFQWATRVGPQCRGNIVKDVTLHRSGQMSCSLNS